MVLHDARHVEILDSTLALREIGSRQAPATENLDMAQDEHRDPSREQDGEGDHLQDQRQVASEMAKVGLSRTCCIATTWPRKLTILAGLSGTSKVSG